MEEQLTRKQKSIIENQKTLKRDLKIISITLVISIIILVTVIFSQSGKVSIEDSYTTAENFIKQSSTFRFDGIENSLIITTYNVLNCSYCYSFIFTYNSRHAGYGDRTGQVLAEITTKHLIEIKIERGQVTSAIVDKVYDEIKEKFINETQSLFEKITETLS